MMRLRTRSTPCATPLAVARLGRRRLQRRRRQRLPRLRRQPNARRPRRSPSPPTVPAIPNATASSRSRSRATSACATRSSTPASSSGPSTAPIRPIAATTASTSCTRICRASPPSAARDRRRRQQRRRSRRLSAGPAGGARVRRAQPARRSRSHEGRDPRAVAPRGAADLGRAGVGLPVVAHSVSHRSDRREAADDRARRSRRCARSASACAASAITTSWRASRSAATRWRARSSPRSRAAIVRALKAVGYRYVTPRSAGLPHGQPERRAVAAAGVSPRRSNAKAPARMVRPFDGLRAHHERPLEPVELSCEACRGLCVPVVLAIVFLAFHLPYLPASLEDLDSVNFALGVPRLRRRAASAASAGLSRLHPGREGRRRHRAVRGHARSRSSASSPARSACWRWRRCSAAWMETIGRLVDRRGRRGHDRAAVLVHGGAAAERRRRPRRGPRGPGDDARRQERPRCSRVAAFCAGLAAGLRSQVVWLTVPLLIVGGWERGLGAGRHARSSIRSPRSIRKPRSADPHS